MRAGTLKHVRYQVGRTARGIRRKFTVFREPVSIEIDGTGMEIGHIKTKRTLFATLTGWINGRPIEKRHKAQVRQELLERIAGGVLLPESVASSKRRGTQSEGTYTDHTHDASLARPSEYKQIQQGAQAELRRKE